LLNRDGRLSPKDLLDAVRVERRADIDQIDASGRQIAQLIQIIATGNDVRIDERRGFGWHAGSYPALAGGVNQSEE
jgi:hypothetical protein